jgi:hypothetical protein
MRAALILACTVAGCGFDPSGLGAEAVADANTVEATAYDDAGPGGAAGGDALPTGAISYFRGATCPTGWSPYEPARGRFVVATIGAVPTGTTSGDALTSGEDRKHQHAFSLTFALKDQSFLAASGGSNGGIASKSAVTISGSTEPSSTGLPYVQLLVCRKSGKPSNGALPRGMQVFFESTTCPEGFAQTETTQGRFVVGLPKGAPPDQTFGRAAGATGAHVHGATAVLSTKPHGITLFSGCCADGYAQNDTYTATGDTSESNAGLPKIELLSCTKS